MPEGGGFGRLYEKPTCKVFRCPAVEWVLHVVCEGACHGESPEDVGCVVIVESVPQPTVPFLLQTLDELQEVVKHCEATLIPTH